MQYWVIMLIKQKCSTLLIFFMFTVATRKSFPHTTEYEIKKKVALFLATATTRMQKTETDATESGLAE